MTEPFTRAGALSALREQKSDIAGIYYRAIIALPDAHRAILLDNIIVLCKQVHGMGVTSACELLTKIATNQVLPGDVYHGRTKHAQLLMDWMDLL